MGIHSAARAAAALLIFAAAIHAQSCAWEIVPTPNPAAGGAALSKPAIVSQDDVWAVGNKTVGSGKQTLVEHWNGAAWSVVTSPNTAHPVNYLTAVAAVSANDVWAVGFAMNAAQQAFTLIEHWNGTAWSVVPSPNPPFPSSPFAPSNKLFGVVAVAANDVWAVGQTYDFSDSQTLIVRWNGTAWAAVASPSPGNQGVLYDVTATSATDVWAVGDHSVVGSQTSLVERWNGTSWSVVASPNVGPFLNSFLAISAIAPNDIWAVGLRLAVFGVNQVNQPAALHWNGSTWSASFPASVNQQNHYLFDVVGISANDVWAVGLFDTGTALRTLVEHWDGLQWSIVNSPNLNSSTDELFGVGRSDQQDVWAVGESFDGFQYVTLAERLGGDGQPNTPAATLTIDGVGAGACPGPRHLAVNAGAILSVAMSGPPGMPAILALGAVANAGVSIGCPGILSIGTPPGFADVLVAANGLDPGSTFQLDGSGNLAFGAPTTGIPSGSQFHVQGAVVQPAGPCGAILTSEFELLVN